MLGFGIQWFWSLGRLPVESESRVVLTVERGIVEIQRAGQSNWSKASSREELTQNDRVRTAYDGRATINFFERAESRLASQTEVLLEQMTEESGEISFLQVTLGLVNGRIWSSVSRLPGLDSRFVVRLDNGDHILTTQSSVFDMQFQVTSTQVAVFRSSLVMTHTIGGPDALTGPGLNLAEDGEVRFDAAQNWLTTGLIPMATRQSEWVQKNLQLDEAFRQRRLIQQKRQLGMFELGSLTLPIRDLMRWSEHLHLVFASTQAPILFARYVERRLLFLDTAKDSPSQAVFQDLDTLEKEALAHLTGPDGPRFRAQLIARLQEIETMWRDIGPSTDGHALKLRVEEFLRTLSSPDEVERLHSSLLILDARLDEIDASSMPDIFVSSTRSLLDQIRQDIGVLEREIDQAPATIPSDRLRWLHGELLSLKAREVALRNRFSL